MAINDDEVRGTELQIGLAIERDRRIAETVRTLIRSSGFVACAYFAYLSIQSLSGQATEANIFIKIISNLSVNQWLAWILAASSSAFAYRSRKLGRDKEKRLGERIRELEARIDPGRSSTEPKH